MPINNEIRFNIVRNGDLIYDILFPPISYHHIRFFRG